MSTIQANVLARQRMEYDNVIDAIDELGTKMRSDNIHHGRLHLFVLLLAGHLLDHLRSEV